MSANKVKHEFRTILNLGSDMLSKHKIQKILRDTKVTSKELNGSIATAIDNQIDIGMYLIRLQLNHFKIEQNNPDKLRDYGRFGIRVYENCKGILTEVNLRKHSIFKDREWAKRNFNGALRISDLVEAIFLCGRLERLKAFN